MEQENYPYNFPQINNIIGKDFDGRNLSHEEINSIVLNFPMWFRDEIIKEINDREITVVVLKNVDGRSHVMIATDDVDLIYRARTSFSGFEG